MKKGLCLCIVLMMILTALPVSASGEVHIFRVSRDVSPGEVFNLYGSGLSETTGINAVYCSTGTAFSCAKINGDDDFISAVLPQGAPAGQYRLTVAGCSEEVILNAPHPQWVEHSRVMAGQTLSVYGQGLSSVAYGGNTPTSVKLSNQSNEYEMQILDNNPYKVTFRVPRNTPAGDYRLYVSCGNDIWMEPDEYQKSTGITVLSGGTTSLTATEMPRISAPNNEQGNALAVWDVAAKGNYVYAQAKDNNDNTKSGLYVFDVSGSSNPQNVTPSDESFHFTVGDAAVGALLVDGNNLFALTWDNPAYLLRYDITAPHNPVLLSKHRLQTVSTPRDMVKIGNYMYIAACGGISVVNLSETNSDSLPRAGYDANLLSVGVYQDTLVYTAFGDSIYFSKVMGDGTITQLGTRQFSGMERTTDVTVNDGYAYVAMRNEGTGTNRLCIFDMRDATSAQSIENMEINTLNQDFRVSEVERLDEDHLYIASLDGRLAFYDTSEPTQPTALADAFIYNWKVNWCAAKDGSRIYCGNTEDDISIIQTTLTASGNQDPFHLGTWWAGDINWENETIMNLSGKEGTDITSDINAAINSIYNQGGGVVSIPAGEYKIGSLEIPDGVVLKGAGMNETVLRYQITGNWFVVRNNPFGEGNDGRMGLYGIRFTADSVDENSPNYPDRIFSFEGNNLSRIFIKNCAVDFPMTRRPNGQTGGSTGNMPDGNQLYSDDGRCMSVFARMKSDLLLDGCNFRSYMGGTWVMSPDGGHLFNVTMRNCSIDMNTGSAHLLGSYVVAENNTITIEKEFENPYDQNSEGIITRGPCYVAGNVVDGAGKEGHNDGEAILTENAGTAQKMGGKVISSTDTVVTVNPERFANNWSATDYSWSKWTMVITSGTGVGQYRFVSAMDEGSHTVTVEQPWDIRPDATSKFVIIQPTYDAIIYDNKIKNCSKGIWLYNNSLDCVIAENESEDSSGMFLDSSDLGYDFTVSYFNRMEGNSVVGVSDKVHTSAIGEVVILWSNVDTYCYNSYGTEIKDNAYDGSQNTGEPVPHVIESGDINGIYIGHADRLNDALEREPNRELSSPALKAGIVSGNTVQNSDRGITVGGDIFPLTWFHKRAYYTSGTAGITLQNNVIENTTLPYSYRFKEGKMPLSGVLQESGKIVTEPTLVIENNAHRIYRPIAAPLEMSLNIGNIASTDESFRLMIAVYDTDGKMIKNAPGVIKHITQGESDTLTVSVDLTGIDLTNHTVKCFLWTGDSQEPVLIQPYIYE